MPLQRVFRPDVSTGNRGNEPISKGFERKLLRSPSLDGGNLALARQRLGSQSIGQANAVTS